MSDLISRSALIEALRKDEEDVYSHVFSHVECDEIDRLSMDLEQFINNQPTIEAIPVVHGEWVDNTGCLDSVRQYKCSNCGKKPITNMNYVRMLTNFCPNCGAKMDGGRNQKWR